MLIVDKWSKIPSGSAWPVLFYRVYSVFSTVWGWHSVKTHHNSAEKDQNIHIVAFKIKWQFLSCMAILRKIWTC